MHSKAATRVLTTYTVGAMACKRKLFRKNRQIKGGHFKVAVNTCQ